VSKSTHLATRTEVVIEKQNPHAPKLNSSAARRAGWLVWLTVCALLALSWFLFVLSWFPFVVVTVLAVHAIRQVNGWLMPTDHGWKRSLGSGIQPQRSPARIRDRNTTTI
jgi:hypothetical protein